MKLNPDCVRAILLSVESVVSPRVQYQFPRDAEQLEKEYSADEVAYHMQQCVYHNFFVAPTAYNNGGLSVKDLSPDGHKFLANIREKTVWNGVKSVAAKVGSTSLEAVVQISSNVITELIKAQFGLVGQTMTG